MVSLTPGCLGTCTARNRSYEAMTSDEMEMARKRVKGQHEVGVCAQNGSAVFATACLACMMSGCWLS